jgi:integrase
LSHRGLSESDLETGTRSTRQGAYTIERGCFDPAALKKAAKQAQANTFERITKLWLDETSHDLMPITHIHRTKRLERHVFPVIGSMAIDEIKPADITALLEPIIAKRYIGTAHRVRAELSAIFCYAIAHGFTNFDPAQSVKAQIPKKNVKHRPAIIDPKELGRLLLAIDGYSGTYVVKSAFRLSPLLFQRPGEIRQMEWKDIDTATKEWRYLVTKTGVDHIVPLSTQAVVILEELRRVTGRGKFVFPCRDSDDESMSSGAICLRTSIHRL